MPFGLHAAPATFQRTLDAIIGADLYPLVFVYLDDIIVLGRDFTEHLKTLETVFERLQAAGMQLNIEKCQFVQSSMKYLGHVVTPEGIRTDPEKVEAVRKLPPPTNLTELRRILGMASWYRRFIPNFSKIVHPLTRLLKKTVQWVWGPDEAEAFNQLKRILTEAPVLRCPDFTLPFFLQTDASCNGLGVVLFQRHSEQESVIAYASRSLSNPEKNYTTTEQECLAIVWEIGRAHV